MKKGNSYLEYAAIIMHMILVVVWWSKLILTVRFCFAFFFLEYSLMFDSTMMR